MGSPATGSGWSHPRFVSLALALVTLLLYSSVWHCGFVVYDDPDYVTENRMVQSGLTASGVKWAFHTFHASNWHPLTWLSHMLDVELFGPDPGAHHLVNVLLHTTNTLLLFALLIRITGRTWPSVVVAGLFAWHPLHVESVAWVAERKDVLSVMFGLLTLLAYTSYATHRTYRTYLLTLLLFGLGLMAKPMLVTLPFIMLLLDYWPLQRVSGARCQVSGPDGISGSTPTVRVSRVSFQRLLMEKWPFFLLSAGSCVMTVLAQRSEAIMSFDQRPFAGRVANAIVAYARYLGKTFWPSDLAVIYPLPDRITGISLAIALAVLLGISWLVWRRRRERYWLMGWLWFVGTLVPVIGLVQVGGQSMADRYTYLPLIGLFIAIAFGVGDWAKRNSRRLLPTAIAAGLIVVSCAGATWHQLGYWRDSETLFSHALAVTRNNDTAHLNLGVALERENRPEAALEQYLTAWRINPNRVQVQNNLANLFANLGRREEALEHYREALRLNPDAPMPHENYGTVLVELGRFDEAQKQYEEAARLAPGDPRPFYLMGKACMAQNRNAAAVARFREALRLSPDDVPSLTYLARILASDADPQVRNGAEASTFAGRANDLTGGEQPFVLDTLAMAHAETGRFENAEQAIARAIELATRAGVTNLLFDMRQRQQLYESRAPYRAPVSNVPPEL